MAVPVATMRSGTARRISMKPVPAPGTLGALLNCVEEAGTACLPGNERMEEAINLRPAAKHDPWT